jgi:hypothetical protein
LLIAILAPLLLARAVNAAEAPSAVAPLPAVPGQYTLVQIVDDAPRDHVLDGPLPTTAEGATKQTVPLLLPDAPPTIPLLSEDDDTTPPKRVVLSQLRPTMAPAGALRIGLAPGVSRPAGMGESGAVFVDLPAEFAEHAIALDALDWLVCDLPAVRRLGDAGLATLLACGVNVAVLSGESPGPRWARSPDLGDAWVLHAPRLAHVDARPSEAVYAAVEGWQPGRPWAFRKLAVAAACAASLLILLAALVTRRGSVHAAVTVSVLAAGGIALWRTLVPPVASVAGEVRVIDGPFARVDTWTFFQSPDDAKAFAKFGPGEVIYPVAYSGAQLGRAKPDLATDPDGRPLAWRFTVPAGGVFAVVSRRVVPTEDLPAATPGPSRFVELARRAYRREGWVIENVGGAITLKPAAVER